jgi:hypothetical protein
VTHHAPVHPRTRLQLAAFWPALASAATALSLSIISSPEDERRPIFVLWLLLVVITAPVVAFLVNRRWPSATNANRAYLAALPQPVIVPLMLRLVVWLDVQTGNVVPDTSEVAMSYGILTVVGFIIGLVLLLLVAAAGSLGARHAGPTQVI